MPAPIRDLHASNAVTYLSLAAGLGAVAVSESPAGRGVACALMAAAALADTFDGRFARRFTRSARQSRVGAETDSLVDAVVFGAVPVVVVSRIVPQHAGVPAAWWWGAAFLYALAVVLRLGSFSADADGDRFVGLPTPAAALVWSTALIWNVPAWGAAGIFLACAAAMVSPVRIIRPRGPGLAAFAAWALVLIIWHLVA
jgi:phosphatidylserine synthase